LGLELELRREQGETPARDEYVAEFPDRSEVIATLFTEVEDLRNGNRPAVGCGGAALDTTVPYPPPDAMPDSRPQPYIGGYELIEEIARGGMGVVYRARHQGLKRLVALKMIKSGSMATFEERERFLREAELAANLDHPNIVPIYEVGEHDDRP